MITSITHVSSSNRIHKVGTQAMAFDAAGNLTSHAGKTYTHGADGRLRTSTTSAGTVIYQYDGLGRRVSKSGPATLVPGGFVRYVYDAAHHLIGKYKADGSPIKEYLWLGDLPVAMIETHPDSTTTAYAIETDHLGTPRLLTDATRAPRWRWTSPPFGEVLPDENPSGLGAITFNLRFPGQYYDKETGLHYNWNRYYDPGTGRYDQSDPIGLAGGWNTYAYVGGNPLTYIDPTGEIGLPGAIYGGIAGGIGGYISGGWKGALYGAGAGALVGAVNPWASHWAGGAAGAATASLLGQGAGNYAAGKTLSDPCNYDFTAAAGAAAGGALGGPLNHAIGRYGPQIRLSEIGRAVGGQSVSRSPALTLGAAAEGATVGSGELAGTGLCSCSR